MKGGGRKEEKEVDVAGVEWDLFAKGAKRC
jgi:hypothetical protein